MPTVLTTEQRDVIASHGEKTWPEECCGFLIGDVSGDVATVTDVIPAANSFPAPGAMLIALDEHATPDRIRQAEQPTVTESHRNRYAIDPNELYGIEKQARERGLGVVGIYHSHPNAPARPSEYDREHACPWYCYVIVSVLDGKAREMFNWKLSDDGGSFNEDQIIPSGDNAPNAC